MSSEQRVRTEPRISVNKLGEYLTASPVRRRRIVSDQKRPSDFIVARYREASEAINRFLLEGQSPDFLQAEIERISGIEPNTPWQAEDYALSSEAIESFLDIYGDLPLDGCELERGDPEAAPLLVAAVQVNVRPDAISRSTNRSGGQTVGAIKLYFPKTVSLSDDAGAYIATTLHQYVNEYFSAYGSADYRRCHVVDVFGQQIFTAPQSFIRRRRDIEAACEEIARAWTVV